MYVLASASLIILMVPGFAMLEAGLVRSKNVATILTSNVLIYVVSSIAYLAIGYHIMFNIDGMFLNNLQDDGFSKYALFLFQMAFVGKVVNIINGGVSGRTRILPLLILAIILSAIIYPLVGNAFWGGGILKDVHDLAGSSVIHSVGGWALLAAILIIGPRQGRYRKDGSIKPFPASNVPLVVLGAFLLWIGWFGFNGGSVLDISSKENADLVAKVIVNTNNAGLFGALAASIILYIQFKSFDITMILNGALGGLVAITAGADVLSISSSLIVGFIGGTLVIFFVEMLDKIKIDDPVGALSVHLVNGIWGTLAVALFSDKFSFMTQAKGVLAVGIFVFISSYIVIYIINKLIPFRVNEESEFEGLDFIECEIESYPEFKHSSAQ
jgi:Amt family ammonium transporter